jgi:hypothetical protein
MKDGRKQKRSRVHTFQLFRRNPATLEIIKELKKLIMTGKIAREINTIEFGRDRWGYCNGQPKTRNVDKNAVKILWKRDHFDNDTMEDDHCARGAEAAAECAIRAELNRSIWSCRMAAAALKAFRQFLFAMFLRK